MATDLDNQVSKFSNPGLDFDFLRQRGLALVEKLSGSKWDAKSIHDPGVTMLEVLSFALVDLSYRLTFNVEDIIAQKPGDPVLKQFFTAREILSSSPITHDDYRKLLIDIPGVRNAWLVAAQDETSTIYCSKDKTKLSFLAKPGYDRREVQGIYDVNIEIDINIINDSEDRLPTQKTRQQLTAEINAIVNQQRSFATVFSTVNLLSTEDVYLSLDVYIDEKTDPNKLAAEIYFNADKFISPKAKFHDVWSLLDRGMSADDIFSGPNLNSGFLLDEDMAKLNKKNNIRVSNLLHEIINLAGIKSIDNIQLAKNIADFSNQLRNGSDKLMIDLDSNKSAKLVEFVTLLENGAIKLYRGEERVKIDLESALSYLSDIKEEFELSNIKVGEFDIKQPSGQYKNLSELTSIQNDFPMVYQVGSNTLPASASNDLKGKTKQLQAYLMIFDQMLANAFAQLDNVKNLLSVNNDSDNINMYASQLLTAVPEAENLIQDHQDLSKLDGMVNSDELKTLSRKDRLFDHLLARFAEKVDELNVGYSLADNSAVSYADSVKQSIKVKSNLLKNYSQLGYSRSNAINYLDYQNSDANNGLKQRLALQLGLNYDDLFILENILLRPMSKVNNNDDFMILSRNCTFANLLYCESNTLGLSSGDTINITSPEIYANRKYKVINVTESGFDIVLNGDEITLDNGAIHWDVLDRTKITCQSVVEDYDVKILCEQQQHFYKVGSLVNISNSDYYDGHHTVTQIIDDNNYIVDADSKQLFLFNQDGSIFRTNNVDSFPSSTVAIEEESYEVLKATSSYYKLSIGDKLTIVGNDNYNGIYEVDSFFSSSAFYLKLYGARLSTDQSNADLLYVYDSSVLPSGGATVVSNDGDSILLLNSVAHQAVINQSIIISDGQHQGNYVVTDVVDSDYFYITLADAAFKLPSEGIVITTNIRSFLVSNVPGFTTVTSYHHELISGDSITISESNNYNGTYTVSNVKTNSFDIEKEFVADETALFTLTYVDISERIINKLDDKANRKQISCISPKHGLYDGDIIRIIDNSSFDSNEQMVLDDSSQLKEDSFNISVLASQVDPVGKWVYANQKAEPYSYQLSIVMPDLNIKDGITKQSQKEKIYRMVAKYVPAHLDFNICWFNDKQLQLFKRLFQEWLENLSLNNSTELENIKFELSRYVKIGIHNQISD